MEASGLLMRVATTIHLPVAYLASLTLRGWAGVVLGLAVLYLRQISTLSDARRCCLKQKSPGEPGLLTR